MTGYLGRAEIGEAALRALAAVRRANQEAAYACDPVIGDVGRGSYVAPGVAEFFRDRAVPAATIVTPNAYELEWLTGAPVTSLAEARDAVMALLARGPSVAVVTSLSLDDTPSDRIDIIAGDRRGLWRIATPKLPIAVNGAGDLFAALFFHCWLEGRSTPEALSRTASTVFGIVAATLAAGGRELALVEAQEELDRPSTIFLAEPL
jgi:pyridoxine kinase